MQESPCPESPVGSSTPSRRSATLRRHFVDKIPVSQLCEEYELQRSVFYYWQRQAFENLAGALQSAATTSSREKDLERENEALKAKLAKKDHVSAEISEEYVAQKRD